MSASKGKVMIRRFMALVVGVALLGSVSEAEAQRRGGAPSAEETACNWIRKAHADEVARTMKSAREQAKAACAAAERECFTALKQTYPLGCTAGDTQACMDGRLACDMAHRACVHFKRLRTVERALVAEAYVAGCEALTAAGCPLKNIMGRQETKHCGQASEIVANDPLDALFGD